MKPSEISLIQTKFFNPKIPSDFIRRNDLIDRMNHSLEYPLTMISAPSGYGKSSLVSDWLGAQDYLKAWLSLGKEENNFSIFMEYLIAAIRKKNETFGESILDLIHAPEPVPAAVIIKLIINEVTQIESEFILVLDDYHFITDPESNQLLETWLKHPSPFFHFIIICRNDPPIPIHQYRFQNKILELRAKDLEFNEEDTGQYLNRIIEKELQEHTRQKIYELSEGWITGLKMIALSLENERDVGNTDYPIDKLKKNFLPKLMHDVLQNLSPVFRNMILALSIVEEFNFELCEYLVGKEGRNLGRKFIDEMERSNLFIILLDDQLNWYRFHHLFADLLYTELRATYSKDEIIELHNRAAEWLGSKNYNEQAILQFIKADQLNQAEKLFGTYRLELLNVRNWNLMKRILNYFSEEYISKKGSLLLTKAWLMVYHGQTFEMFHMIDSVREIIENEDLPERERELLLAECYCLLTYRVYHIDQDFEKCIEYGEFALSKLPVECHYPIGFAWVFLGGALQAKGRSQEAIDKLYKAIDKSISEDIKNMTLLVINYIYWLEGDSDHLKKSSEQLIEYGKANHNSEAIVNGYLFLGSNYYMIGDLQNAAISYENVLSMRYHVIGIQSFFGITALIYTYLFSKEFGKLDATALELDHIVNEAGGQVFRSFWKAFEAEIKMFRSQTPQALNWLENAHEFPLIPITNYSDPHLSMIRILLMEGSMENMNKALKILEELEEMLNRTNNRRVSASIYVGKAIYFNKMQDSEKSATFIVQALVIAELGNNVMVFVEYGQLVIPAIRNYTKLNGAHHLLSKAFTLINRNDSIIDQKDFTHRELEIIPLLNLSNKEIAKKLFIAEKTVKRHSNSIFKKLQVKNRREAYQKAKEMKLP